MGRVAEKLSSALIPKAIRFEFQLASRHLRSGGGQTLLTIGAVATGVTIVIFVTSLIFGLQERQTELLTGNIPHVTVQVQDPSPRPLDGLAGSSNPISSKIEQQAPQLKFIDDWEHVVRTIRELPNVLAAVPVVSGQGFASKGENRVGVGMVGADPVLHETITPVTADLIAGSYTGLGSDEAVIDAELAEDLNVSIGDRIRLTSSSGISDDFIIRGIYSQGRGRGNAYVTLRTGQSLFGYGTSVN
jgi:lipoprotein-releasing system permease protein